MSVDDPELLGDSVHNPAFWARYLFVHEDGPGADRLGDLDTSGGARFEAVFGVGGGYRIMVSIDTDLDGHYLSIGVPGSAQEADLAWDDLVHWHPYVLRWSELDLICRAIGTLDPQWTHPGAPLALLGKFTAVFEDDTVDSAVRTMDEAFASLRPPQWDGYWPVGTDWLARSDFRGQNVAWQRDPAGNLWASQDDDHGFDFYTTRLDPSISVFPYPQFRAMLSAAATTLETGVSGPVRD